MRKYWKPNRKTAPISHPTTLDIAWAAGLYEGEGCVEAQQFRGGKKASLKITIGQKEPWILEKLKQKFGGGHYHRFSKEDKRRGDYSLWVLYGARAAGFIMTIYSFLSPHRQKQLRHGLHSFVTG